MEDDEFYFGWEKQKLVKRLNKKKGLSDMWFPPKWLSINRGSLIEIEFERPIERHHFWEIYEQMEAQSRGFV